MTEMDKLNETIKYYMNKPTKYCEDCFHFSYGKCYQHETEIVSVSPTFSCGNWKAHERRGSIMGPGGSVFERQQWEFWTRVKSGW